MFNGGRNIRAYRPGRRAEYGDVLEIDLEIEKSRQSKVMLYAARVSAGLPIFDGQTRETDANRGELPV